MADFSEKQFRFYQCEPMAVFGAYTTENDIEGVIDIGYVEVKIG